MPRELRYPLACPFAALAEPVLSPNDEDVQCGITGGLQPSEVSPCCENSRKDYWQCSVRRRFMDTVEIMGRPRAERELLGDRPHVLPHATRELSART